MLALHYNKQDFCGILYEPSSTTMRSGYSSLMAFCASLYPSFSKLIIVSREKSAALPNMVSGSSLRSMYTTLVTSNLPSTRSLNVLFSVSLRFELCVFVLFRILLYSSSNAFILSLSNRPICFLAKFLI